MLTARYGRVAGHDGAATLTTSKETPVPRPPTDGPRDAGVTLVESIVAIFLFAMVATASASLMAAGIGVSRDARNRTAAAVVASEAMEQARAASLAAFTTLASSGTTTATYNRSNGLVLTVTQTAVFVPKNAPSGACTATNQGGAAGVQPVLLVTESVTWPGMRTTRPVTASTTVTPPVGAYSDATGGIDVKVVGQAGVRLAGITVTARSNTSGSVLSLTTDSNGCAYAAFLAPGTYTVATGTAGYVDTQERTPSTVTVGVVTGQVAQATFYVDRAVELDAVFATPSYGGVPVDAATGLPVTVGNSGLAGTGSFSFGAGTTQLTPLYPYSSYGVWAGHCPEAYPAAVDGSNHALYAGATTTTATPLTGSPTAVTVPLYRLVVQTRTQQGNNPLDGATVTVTEQAGAASTLCTSLQTYGLPTSTSVGGTSGLSIAGVPLGTYTVTVSYGGSTSTKNVTVGTGGQTVTVKV